MHYYKFNIKDYSYATIRMSLMEDLAFRRMLDLFYETEKPLPNELARIARLIGMRENQEEIRNVLNDFWEETEEGWVNSRASEEISEYQLKASTARANGKKGGRPKNPEKTQLVSDRNPEKSESKANHKPLTINQETINKINTSFANDGFEHFWKVYPRKEGKTKAKSKFISLTKKMDNDEFCEFVDLISKDCVKRYENTEKKFIPHGSKYMNQELWQDEL